MSTFRTKETKEPGNAWQVIALRKLPVSAAATPQESSRPLNEAKRREPPAWVRDVAKSRAAQEPYLTGASPKETFQKTIDDFMSLPSVKLDALWHQWRETRKARTKDGRLPAWE